MDTSITHRSQVVTSQYGPTNKHAVVSAYIRCEWLWKLMGHTIYHCTCRIPSLLNGFECIYYYWQATICTRHEVTSLCPAKANKVQKPNLLIITAMWDEWVRKCFFGTVLVSLDFTCHQQQSTKCDIMFGICCF